MGQTFTPYPKYSRNFHHSTLPRTQRFMGIICSKSQTFYTLRPFPAHSDVTFDQNHKSFPLSDVFTFRPINQRINVLYLTQNLHQFDHFPSQFSAKDLIDHIWSKSYNIYWTASPLDLPIPGSRVYINTKVITFRAPPLPPHHSTFRPGGLTCTILFQAFILIDLQRLRQEMESMD